jgi:hypothetical protein
MYLDSPDDETASSGSSPLRGKVDWDAGLRDINRWFDQLVVAYREKDQTTRDKLFAELEADVNKELTKSPPRTGTPGPIQELFKRNQPERIQSGQYYASMLVSMLPSRLEKVKQAEERAEQVQRNLVIAFALAAYRDDTGRYPDSLDKLVPKYLEGIPNDLFTGKPLRYRLTEEGYLLYSVGVNGVDDNGIEKNEEMDADDLSVRMPPP